MKLNEFWNSFIYYLKNESGPYYWDELVSQPVRELIESDDKTDEAIRNMGLMGINFNDYAEHPMDLKYLSSSEKEQSITVIGNKYKFTFHHGSNFKKYK